MSQIEELKVFVSERLHAAASEILGAIDKTITDYEAQASRLKEENERHRSLLDIIVKSKLSEAEAGQAKKSRPSAAAGLRPLEAKFKRKTTAPFIPPNESRCLFTSREEFLQVEANGNCPYCLKRIQATETHLMKRHYFFAVHFTQGGTEKFVIPCMCKDKIQGRSHWHCPYCLKIIYRKCNFESHLSKIHGYVVLQQSQDAETNQASVSVFEEGVPPSPEPWSQRELGGLDEEEQQASLLLQIKEEAEQVGPPEVQYSEQLQVRGEPVHEGNDQMGGRSLEPSHAQESAFSIVCVDGFIQDIGEIGSVRSSRRHPLPNSSAEATETRPDSGVSEASEPAGESQRTAGNSAVAENGSSSKNEEWKKTQSPRSSLKTLSSKGKKCVKRSPPTTSLNVKKPPQLPARQKPAGSHCCKACGKSFHYMYTLRAHVQTHAMDKTHICGICGKHSESTESLVQHLQSHTKRNKCGRCGKQFSSSSRLNRHMKFHRPKVLNVMSSA